MQQPQGGFGGQGFGQSQPQFGGFGGGQGFGRFGGGQGFGGFGGFGGGQGFSPFQGGFQPQGYGGGYGGFGGGYGGGFNPMFGGIGGLGFNPMMGRNFGMPMGGFGGFNPYQQQQQFNPYQQQQQQQFAPQKSQSTDQQFDRGMTMDMRPGDYGYGQPVMGDMMYRGGPEMSPQMRMQREQDMRQMERMATQSGEGRQQYQPQPQPQPQSPFTGPQVTAQDILEMAVKKRPGDMQYDLNKDGNITSADALAYHRQYGQQPAPTPAPTPPQTPVVPYGNGPVDRGDYWRKNAASGGEHFGYPGGFNTMFGGIGGLGFNPMMGRNFGMPMLQGMQANSPQGRAAMGSLGSMSIQPLSSEQQQLLGQLPQQVQASPSANSFAQLTQMLNQRMPQANFEPQQAAPQGMKWMLGHGGYSLVPQSKSTYEAG